jgi:hypothetical protein
MPTEIALNYRRDNVYLVSMNIFKRAIALSVCLLGFGITLCHADSGITQSGNSPRTSHYERPKDPKGPFKEAVIVFVHGMFGDAADTWTSANGTYWPRLLLADTTFDNYDVYVASYATSGTGSRYNMHEVVASLENRLTNAGVFAHHRQVIFVCHSLGGIVVQQLLITFPNHASQVPLIYFFAVPQEGSQIATIAKVFSSDTLLKYMFQGNENEYMEGLEDEWKGAHFKIERYCAFETKPYKGMFVIVDRLSGTRNCDEVAVPIDEDHVGIVKPNTEDHESYVALRVAVLENPISTSKSTPAKEMVTMSREQFRALMGAIAKQSQPSDSVENKDGHEDLNSDLRDMFYGKDRLIFVYKNPTRTTALKPRIGFGLMDLTNPYLYSFVAGEAPTPQPFPIPGRVLSDDYVRPGEIAGNEDVLQNFMRHVKRGDVIWGVASITCINCVQQRAYYVYWKAGEGGWYAEADSNNMQLPKPVTTSFSDEQINQYVDTIVPMNERQKMKETFSH